MIAVTGSAGLLGAEIVDQLLRAGKKVRALYNRNVPAFQGDDVELVECDILDVERVAEVLGNVQEVYHCAALVSFKGNDARELYKLNVEGTANVVNACLDSGTRKLVHISSVAALGKTPGIISESTPWNDKVKMTNYARSKYLSEMEVWRGAAEGLETAILNPSVILGAGDWSRGSTAIFRSVFNEFPWYTEGSTGFVDVQDVARAAIVLMESDISRERFVINGVNMPYRDLFRLVASCFNKKEPHRKVSPFMASLVWRFEKLRKLFTGHEPLVTRETARSAMAKVSYDNSKFLAAFPEFRYTPIEETVKHICTILQHKVNIG